MAGRLVVELESIHLTTKRPRFKGLKAFAVLQYKNEEKRGHPRKVLGMVYNWGETFDFNVEGNPKAGCISMDVYKEKNQFDELIGTCKIPLNDTSAERGEPLRITLPLTADGKIENRSNSSNMGHTTILVRYYPSAPQLQAALEKAEERVLKLERELQLKIEQQREQNVGEAATSRGHAVNTDMCSDSLAATISKVEQLRFQTQVRKLENEMKWVEKNIKWEENDVRFAVSQANWEENNTKWIEKDARFVQIQPKQTQSIMEMCKTILKADLLNFGYHLVDVTVWFTRKIRHYYKSSTCTNDGLDH